MRGSTASLPGRPADCCLKIGSGARYTPVTGSRTQSSFRQQREQEVTTRRSEFVAILKNERYGGSDRNSQPQDRSTISGSSASNLVRSSAWSGSTEAIETERGIELEEERK